MCGIPASSVYGIRVLDMRGLKGGIHLKGLILCGGRGTRLLPYTYSQPKPLLPVANKPVIEHAIAKLNQAGIQEIGIVVAPYYESQFHDIVGVEYEGAKITYIQQVQPKGLAHAIKAARSFIQDDPFLVYLGDIYYSGDLHEVVESFQSHEQDATVLTSIVHDPRNYGVVQLEDTKVVHLVEKPLHPVSPYALIGIYVFTSQIFEVIERLSPSARAEYELTDAIQGLVDTGRNVNAMITTQWWQDTGTMASLLACNRRILMELDGTGKQTRAAYQRSAIDGPVVIGQDVEIVDSIVRGPVVIGDGCRICRSYIGPYTSIGNDVRLERSEIENSIVLEGAYIKKIQQRIDESIIGRNAILEQGLKLPKTLKVQIGDHSQLHLPFDER